MSYIDNHVEEFLNYRGLPFSAAYAWNIGWEDDAIRNPILRNRITFPIRNYGGDILTICGRATLPNDRPKYWHGSFRKGRWLYGLWRGETRYPILVEGQTDCWALEATGHTAYGVMGSTLTAFQAAHIAGMTSICIVLPDRGASTEQWRERLAELGVYMLTPTSLYEPNDDVHADPCWLYVNERVRLLAAIRECKLNAMELSRRKPLSSLLEEQT